jgi:hypothetical protein
MGFVHGGGSPSLANSGATPLEGVINLGIGLLKLTIDIGGVC